jgi:hypothetical protein
MVIFKVSEVLGLKAGIIISGKSDRQVPLGGLVGDCKHPEVKGFKLSLTEKLGLSETVIL